MTLGITHLAANFPTPPPQSTNQPTTTNQTSNKDFAKVVNEFLAIFVILVIIDIIILYYTIKAVMTCQKAGKWGTGISILLILICLFVPGIGFMLSIFLIVYGNISCGREELVKTSPNAFKFKI